MLPVAVLPISELIPKMVSQRRLIKLSPRLFAGFSNAVLLSKKALTKGSLVEARFARLLEGCSGLGALASL